MLSIAFPIVARIIIIGKFKFRIIAIIEPIIVAIADIELLLLSKCSLFSSVVYLKALNLIPPQCI